jgi:hypothetical protein
MADGGGSGESARARGERPGWVYMGDGGRLRGRGVNHVAGVCAAWAARRCNVRRGGGQWRAAVSTPASQNWPPGAVQTLAIVTHSGIPARRMDRWVRRCLGVRARRAYGHWRGTRAQRRVWARSGVPGQKQVGRGFVQEFKQERHANLAIFSAPVNSRPGSCFAIFTLLHSEPAMPLNSKVVCLNILHIFPFGWF